MCLPSVCACVCACALKLEPDDNQGRYHFGLFHQSKQACSSKQTLIFKSKPATHWSQKEAAAAAARR